MLIEQAIYKILKADTGVTDQVVGRIFSGVAPQALTTYPVVVYRPNGNRRIVALLDGGCTLVQQRIEILSGGRTFAEAALTDAAVGDALHEFHDTVVNLDASPQESIDVQGIFMDLPAHEYVFDDKTQLHQFVTDFMCHFIDPRRITV